jgi:hypothetical protein
MNTDPHLCRIDSALGRTRQCPKELCGLWFDNACVVAGLRADLLVTPGLPEFLLGLRERLDGPAASGVEPTLVPPGLR